MTKRKASALPSTPKVPIYTDTGILQLCTVCGKFSYQPVVCAAPLPCPCCQQLRKFVSVPRSERDGTGRFWVGLKHPVEPDAYDHKAAQAGE